MRLAQSMLEAGVLQDLTSELTLSDLVTSSLNDWMASIWGHPAYFDMGVHLLQNFKEAIESYEQTSDEISVQDTELRTIVLEECGLDPIEDHLCLLFSSMGRADMLVGEGVERLEALHKGLGYEVLRQIENIGMSFGLLGGCWLEMVAQQTQWCGGESETDWAEMNGEDAEDFAGVTKAEFDEAVPRAWVSTKPMSLNALRNISRTGSDEARKAASLLLAIRKLNDKAQGFQLGGVEGFFEMAENLEATVLLGWKSFDVVYQMCDDYTNNRWSGDCADSSGIGIELMPTNDPSWFARTKAKWKPKADAVNMIDALLCIVAKEG